MSAKKKILVPIFNRAHYGRLRSVLKAILNHPRLELQIMAASPAALGGFLTNIRHSSPYSWRLALPWYVRARLLSFVGKFNPNVVLESDFLARSIVGDGFKIASRVPLFLDGGTSVTMAKTVGLGLVKIVDELERLKPDIVLINADRFEMMSVALAAAYLNIPIAHNEGGDVSGTIDESVRHAITKFAHIHFTSTEESRRRVVKMGEQPDFVFTVGSPSIDILKNLDLSFPDNAFAGFDASKPYLLVLIHPIATDSKERNKLMTGNIIGALEELKVPTIFLGSNIDAGSDQIGRVARAWRDKKKPNFVFFAKHLPPDIFFRVLAKAACALGNSSSFIREGSYFGTPAVLVGDRQQNRQRAENVVEVRADTDEIVGAVRSQLKKGRYPSSNLFGDGTSGEKIAHLLATIEPKIQKNFYDGPSFSA